MHQCHTLEWQGLTHSKYQQPALPHAVPHGLEKNSLDKVILRPKGADEQCGVQDPRITVDKKSGLYIMAYTAFGDGRAHPKVCNASSCGPSWQACMKVCRFIYRVQDMLS